MTNWSQSNPIPDRFYLWLWCLQSHRLQRAKVKTKSLEKIFQLRLGSLIIRRYAQLNYFNQQFKHYHVFSSGWFNQSMRQLEKLDLIEFKRYSATLSTTRRHQWTCWFCLEIGLNFLMEKSLESFTMWKAFGSIRIAALMRSSIIQRDWQLYLIE